MGPATRAKSNAEEVQIRSGEVTLRGDLAIPRNASGASHLIEEPGTLDQVAHLAADWFQTHMTNPRRSISENLETSVA
jgi:hypothetical protein